MSTQLSVIPQGTQLPAHLQGPDAAAAIAAANAAAAGGIKTGGFPRISIKGGKFHEKDGGETKTYFMPALPGQPALPMMCLEAVIVAANPALTKLYYPGDYVEGDDKEPACSSTNGVTPDAHIAAPQNNVCATCPQNRWGSKVSNISGKDIKACDDNKQLVVLPAVDLVYKALGLTITKAALTDWGKYVKALSERGIPVDSIVTNLTFDATASFPKLQFAYNRFLTAEEYAKVKERQQGDDVKLIVAQSRSVAAPLALAAPAPAAPPVPAAQVPPTPPAPAPAPVQTGVQFPPETASFGAVTQPTGPEVTTAVLAPAPTEPAKRTRRTRAQIAADEAAAAQGAVGALAGNDPLAHLDATIRTAVIAAGGADSPVGRIILAQFPPPVQTAPVDPLAHLDAATKATIAAVGGPDSVAGKAILAAFSQPAAVQEPGPTPVIASSPVPANPPAPAAAPTPPPGTAGFGAALAPAPQVAPAGPSDKAMALRDLLMKKLGVNQPAAPAA